MNMMQKIGIGFFLFLLLTACAQRSASVKEPSTNKILSPEQTSGKAINSIPTLGSNFSLDEHPFADNQLSEQLHPDQSLQNKNTPIINKPSSVWDRLFSLYALPQVSKPDIDKEIQWYVKHPDYLRRVQQRAAPYLYNIVEQIEKSGIPGEIALLPIVESAFRPYAFSSGRAVGIWQFIPGTGKHYGLKQNWWYDGRRDVYASTQAAIRYFKKLHREFNGDWLLALAAYNSGEGRVATAVRRNRRNGKPTDFWHLKLPRETRNYVPRLLAIAQVLKNAPHYGITLSTIPNAPVFEAVDIGSQLDLAVAAKSAEMEISDLFRFNPGFNRWATPPNGPHLIMIPVEKSAIFKSNLAKLNKQDRLKWTRHKIQTGDTLGHIAGQYGTSSSVLRQVNHIRGDIIYPGKTLMIPLAKLNPSYYQHLRYGQNPATAQAPNGKKILYTVKSGDSFWLIARKYSVNMKKLAQSNSMSVYEVLRPGQKLTIWAKSPQFQTSQAENPMNPFQTIIYRVRKGDSLYLISQRFNVKIADLRRWNSSKLGKYLKPGQMLKVQVDITQPST